MTTAAPLTARPVATSALPLGLALALAIPAAIGAQASVNSVVLHPTRGVQVGQTVRVSLGGDRRVGEVRSIARDTLFLGATASPIGIRIASIDTLWQRGNYERVGSNAAMVTLGLLGVAAVGAIYVGAAEAGDDLTASHWGAIALGGVAGAAVGWFTGAVVGSAIPRWRRLYPR